MTEEVDVSSMLWCLVPANDNHAGKYGGTGSGLTSKYHTKPTSIADR